MELIYESEFATIYCGDARRYVENAERAGVDLLATDPPYGQSFLSNMAGNHVMMQGDDDRETIIETLALVTKVIRPGRHVYVFGYTPDDLKASMRLSKPVELIWHKGNQPGMGDLTSAWGPSHERVTFGSFVPSAGARNDGRGSLSARLRKGTVLTIPRRNGIANNRHPTEKPVELMRQLIESSSCIGETVLDPFAGSGSTLVAAIVSGRRCVGVEIDEKYARIAVQRVKAAERVYGQIAGL